MTLLYNAEQVRELDRIAIEDRGIPGIVLMKRAGETCVKTLLENWPAPSHVAVLCGSGNNAGDGFIIAGLLKAKGVSVSISLVGKEPVAETDAYLAYQFSQENGVELIPAVEGITKADLLVDALLGTGAAGTVREAYARVIDEVNKSGVPVLAVDLPSGLSADTGATLGHCTRADVTVSFIGRKLGLMTGDGPEKTGEVVFDDLGVPADIYGEVPHVARLLDYASLSQNLKPRHKNAHKVSHGHVLIVGGDNGMAGAVSLASEAALYSGAGMVTVATQPENVAAIITRRPEVMARGISSAEELDGLIERASVLVVGPGLGQSNWSTELLERVFQSELPMVVDADGLNLLANNRRKNRNWILTPHPGEASRLLSGIESADFSVQSNRLHAAQRLQAEYGGTVLLKGSGTLIRSENETCLCPYGNPGMSVAGMGDLLAGTIGGLLAQGLTNDLATQIGASIHSLAADKVVNKQGERGLLATELLPVIRQLVNKR